MAELRPIKPLLYNTRVVPDISAVITPPYDVMSPEEQAIYRARSPYSAIHIELPVASDGLSKYQVAAQLLEEWQRAGVLRPWDDAAFFVHRQEFEVGGEVRARTALLAGVRLEPWEAGVVLPHERTFRGPKQDRLELLRATAVAPSSVFSLYEQPQAVREAIEAATRTEPLYRATEAGVTHTLWAMADAASVEAMSEAMADRQLYIADGHHRYETALAYRDERRAAEGGSDPDRAYNFLAMSLVAFDDPGLVVLPTHRLVSGVSQDAVDRLPQTLPATGFRVDVREERAAYQRTEEWLDVMLDTRWPDYAFFLYDGRRMMRVTGVADVKEYLPSDRSEAWRALDLAALHELVFGRALGIPADRLEEHVRYTRDVPGAFAQVDEGQAQLAAFVRPTSVQQLRAVADAHDKMPQKSTYFYPKFPAGLVINRLDVRLPAVARVGSS